MQRKSHQRPTISIVTPSFNQAGFLERTIQSVLGQDGIGRDFDLQYVIIDGGSQDGSAAIIESHADHLHHWCSEPDRGQTHAINKGMAVVDGDIRCYLNSDDVLMPGALSKVVAAVRSDSQADLFHGICVKIDADDQTIGQQISSIDSLLKMIDLWDVWLRPGDNRNFIQPEVFWTRRMAERLGPFDESLHYCMDFDYWLRAFDAGVRTHRIDLPLAGFRIHESQKTTDRVGAILELIDRIEPMLSRENDPRLSAKDRRRILHHVALARRTIELSGSEKVRELVSLGRRRPALLTSPHYWKQLRRGVRSIGRAA